jgi:L,D-peptidoglycan transpeptidase YkuD (ErfK/YbiS/YcfS/YnhG family)
MRRSPKNVICIMKKLAFFAFIAAFAGPCRATGCLYVPAAPDTPVLHATQLLVVVSDTWNSIEGSLFGFEKRKGKWKLRFYNAIVVGSGGMGIGRGLVNIAANGAPIKKEGDKRSPAGIFTIGPSFGYADYPDANWLKVHYIRATDTLICVDDPHSVYYNTLRNNDSLQGDWHSYEQMHRKDNYYKWGLFVNYNSGNPVTGDGSCIFLHIWENDREGTDGCTAMKEEDILRVLHWIDAKQDPLLVQLPRKEYERIRKQLDLPRLN